MVRLRLVFASVLVFGLLVSVSFAGQSWQGAQIMPNSPQVSIQGDDGSTTSMYDISWPATVQRTKGRYLWIQDDGGYSRNQIGGWIYCDDAVRLDAARDHFTNELRRGETAWLYWMRGICWESKGEPGVALIDYRNALRVDPNTTIDDVQIRLGRIFAAEQLLNGRGKYESKLRDTWEGHFKSARQINPNRPQLFYEWGYALSQVCDCTISEQQAVAEKTSAEKARAEKARAKTPISTKSGSAPAPAKSSGDSAPAKGSAEPAGSATVANLAARGLDTADDSPAELPRPVKKTSPAAAGENPPSEKSASKPAASPTPDYSDDSAPAAITTAVRAAPTEAGAEAAVQALDCYVTAEELSPNWWRIPLARAELMLNQCDEESPLGERVAVSPVQTKFFTQLLSHHKKNALLPLVSASPASQDLAARGGEEIPNDGGVKVKPSKPEALSPYSVAVLNTAIDDFNRAISLNSNALDAYRDRAEVLRLVNRLGEAQESATMACNLCYYRQARSLRTLAQIYKDTRHYQPAADYALRAAELTSGDEQQHFLQLWYAYSQLASGDTAKIAVASAQAGYVASRNLDDNGDGNSKTSQPPAHIDPPPGFLPRQGSGE